MTDQFQGVIYTVIDNNLTWYKYLGNNQWDPMSGSVILLRLLYVSRRSLLLRIERSDLPYQSPVTPSTPYSCPLTATWPRLAMEVSTSTISSRGWCHGIRTP